MLMRSWMGGIAMRNGFSSKVEAVKLGQSRVFQAVNQVFGQIPTFDALGESELGGAAHTEPIWTQLQPSVWRDTFCADLTFPVSWQPILKAFSLWMESPNKTNISDQSDALLVSHRFAGGYAPSQH